MNTPMHMQYKICDAYFFFFPLDVNCFYMASFLVIMIFLLPIAVSVGLIFEYVLIGITCFLGYHLVWVEVAVAAISLKHGGNICDGLMFQARPGPDPHVIGLNIITKKASGQIQWQRNSISSSSLLWESSWRQDWGRGSCHRTLPDWFKCFFMQPFLLRF